MIKTKSPQVKRVTGTTKMDANRKYVLGLCKADGIPRNIDLSDDKQYDFLVNLRGGTEYLKTYFPHSHQLLENSRQKAIMEKKANKVTPKHMTLLEKVAVGDDISDWQDNIQLVGYVNSTTQAKNGQNDTPFQLNVTGLVGFVDGLEELNTTLQIYNSNTGEIIDSNANENLLQNGYDTLITAAGTTTSLDGIEACLVVDYLRYNSQTKDTKVLKISLADKLLPIAPPTVNDPVHKAARPNLGFIKICLGRQDTDCDYTYTAQPQPYPPIPNVTVKGNATFSGPITDPAAGAITFGALFFVKKRSGGATQLFADYANIYKYFKANGNSISWDFQPATFDKAPWDQGEEVDLNLTVQVSVNGKPKNGQFQITSLKSVPVSAATTKIDPLHFFWGCLSADSMVLMEDGTQKRIDSIKIGEMIQTDTIGDNRKVVDIVTGEEEKPCLHIVTKNKLSVLVTDEHPICKAGKFCFAKDIQVGDLIKTQSGMEEVAIITKEQYVGTVYNLKLEGGEITGMAHYANGVLVGDGNMQGALLKQQREELMRIRDVKELPAQWQFDAENAKRLREGKTLIPAG
jgi:hypothetical protein